MVKGALLKNGESVLTQFTKASYGPSGKNIPFFWYDIPVSLGSVLIHRTCGLDSIFIARLYSSESAEIYDYTNEGDLEHLVDWKIDLRVLPSFRRNAKKPPEDGFDTGDGALTPQLLGGLNFFLSYLFFLLQSL